MLSGGIQIHLRNLADVPAGATFNLTLELTSVDTTGTVSPTMDVRTFEGAGLEIDQVLNVPFTTTPLTNTNLDVLNTFTVPASYTAPHPVTTNYVGPLLLSFTPSLPSSIINGSAMVLTLPTGFYPNTNTLSLPLSCQINQVNMPCSYTLSPFAVTLTRTENSFNTGNNIINITTMHLNNNGIQHPTTPGKYLMEL